MPEGFKPFYWDPDKIVAGRLTADRIVAESVDYSDLVRDPTFPWLLTTRQDLESRRQTTTASSTGSLERASAPPIPSGRPLSQRASPARRRISRISRQLKDLLKRAGGSSGY